MSNWENRPLRKSQQHYGAVDAYVLVVIMHKLIDMAKKQSFADEYTDHVYTLDIRHDAADSEFNSADYSDEVIG